MTKNKIIFKLNCNIILVKILKKLNVTHVYLSGFHENENIGRYIGLRYLWDLFSF